MPVKTGRHLPHRECQFGIERTAIRQGPHWITHAILTWVFGVPLDSTRKIFASCARLACRRDRDHRQHIAVALADAVGSRGIRAARNL